MRKPLRFVLPNETLIEIGLDIASSCRVRVEDVKYTSMIAVTDQEFEEKVLKSKTPVLVDFWAVWCGPCRLAEPVLEELSDTYKDKIVVAKLDVDQNKATPEKYDIMSIPTTVLFNGGKEIDRQVGFSGKDAYEELVKKAI